MFATGEPMYTPLVNRILLPEFNAVVSPPVRSVQTLDFPEADDIELLSEDSWHVTPQTTALHAKRRGFEEPEYANYVECSWQELDPNAAADEIAAIRSRLRHDYGIGITERTAALR